MVAVEYEDLLLALEFVSSSPPTENSAYVSLDTGKIYWASSLNPIEDDAPDDLEESDRYIAVPHKNDLDLGQDLAFRFVAQELPDDYERVRGSSGTRALTRASNNCSSPREFSRSGTSSKMHRWKWR